MRAQTFGSGGLLAVAAAVMFGASAPVIARFGSNASPFTTAALLYAGAFASCLPWLRRALSLETRIAPDLARIAVIAVLGAAFAPALFAWGVARSGAVAGSLLLNTEAGFTVLLARAFYREPITKQMMLALSAMTLGGVVLALTSESSGGAIQWLGAAAVAAATLAWALDNTFTRPLAHRDSTTIVALKSAFGALLTVAASRALHEPVPPPSSILALGVCGAASYGLSLRFYLQAQRTLGAARTASVFALAPFIGALLAALTGDRPNHPVAWLAAPLFAVGVWLHLRERHDHPHVHEPTEHEHAHRHDDGHHDHSHPFPVIGEHVHSHRHERVEHAHEHGLDEAHDHHGRSNG